MGFEGAILSWIKGGFTAMVVGALVWALFLWRRDTQKAAQLEDEQRKIAARRGLQTDAEASDDALRDREYLDGVLDDATRRD